MCTITSFIRAACGLFFFFAIAVITLLGTGCNYITEDDLDQALDENTQAIYDSLSRVYSVVEVYAGVSAGGETYPAYESDSTTAPYTGANHYRTCKIPGGLNPGDKVFAIAEMRFARTGAANVNVTPQAVISVTSNPNTHPNPSSSVNQSNLDFIAPNYNDATWNLEQQIQTIDRSGVYTKGDGAWSEAHVNFHARIYYNGSLNSTFGVSAHSLSVIVVRA